MNDLRQQHGDHTWDIIIEYFKCPKCGLITEDRKQYKKENNIYVKEIICDECKHHFVATKKRGINERIEV